MKKCLLVFIAGLFSVISIAQPLSDGQDISIKFDGTPSGRILLSDMSATLGTSLNSFTVEFWCKRYATSETDKWGNYFKIAFASDKGFYMQVPNGEGFTCVTFNAGVKAWKRYAPATDTNLDTWMHVAWVYSNSDFKLYIDGVEVSHTSMSGTIPATIDASGAVFDIGNKLACNMKDFRLWKKAVTESEIIASMNSFIEPSTDLVLNLRMDDNNTATSVNDNSGNGFHGTISDASSTVYEPVGTPTAIGDSPFEQSNFRVYPNPMNDKLSIEVENNSVKNISFYSLTGQKVKDYSSLSVSNDVIVLTPELNSGVYILVTSTQDGKKYTTKVIVN